MTSLQVFADSNIIEQLFMFGFLGFVASMALTPLYTTAAYAGQWWKKARTHTMTGEIATVYSKLHAANPPAKPSKPSVIFTAFAVAKTTRINSGTISQPIWKSP